MHNFDCERMNEADGRFIGALPVLIFYGFGGVALLSTRINAVEEYRRHLARETGVVASQ